MDMLLPLFQLMYFVVHILYSLTEAVTDCFIELYYLLGRLLYFKKFYNPEPSQVLNDMSRLKKVPRHIGFIFASGHSIDYKIISDLIKWSIMYNIRILSLYDLVGILKLNLPTLLDNLCKINLNVPMTILIDGQTFMSKTSFNGEQTNNSENFKLFNRKWSQNVKENLQSGLNNIVVNILSVEDGREDVLRVAKRACDSPHTHLHNHKNASCMSLINEINENCEYITKNLISKNQIDPDLIAVIGRPLCLMHYPPWQIRLTEFLNIPSVTRVNYSQFNKLLQKFSKCEQRVGC